MESRRTSSSELAKDAGDFSSKPNNFIENRGGKTIQIISLGNQLKAIFRDEEVKRQPSYSKNLLRPMKKLWEQNNESIQQAQSRNQSPLLHFKQSQCRKPPQRNWKKLKNWWSNEINFKDRQRYNFNKLLQPHYEQNHDLLTEPMQVFIALTPQIQLKCWISNSPIELKHQKVFEGSYGNAVTKESVIKTDRINFSTKRSSPVIPIWRPIDWAVESI